MWYLHTRTYHINSLSKLITRQYKNISENAVDIHNIKCIIKLESVIHTTPSSIGVRYRDRAKLQNKNNTDFISNKPKKQERALTTLGKSNYF